MSEHSDPLDPVYKHGMRIEEDPVRKSGVRSKTNLAVLVVVLVVLLVILFYLGRDKPEAAPAAPADTEIR